MTTPEPAVRHLRQIAAFAQVAATALAQGRVEQAMNLILDIGVELKLTQRALKRPAVKTP